MKIAKPLAACLWHDGTAEEAANFYVSIFDNSKIRHIQRYAEEGKEIHRQQPGSVMVVEFELNGQPFVALNGGPLFKFNESVSFQIFCDSQKEIDFFWEQLSGNGGTESVCGWLKDRFGMSWQVVPTRLTEMLQDPKKSEQVTRAFMQMKKFDIAKLEAAYAA